MKRILAPILTLALVAVLASSYATQAKDGPKESKVHLENKDYWNQFRGPSGDGKTLAKNLPVEFSETKNVRWKTPIHDEGWSSPVVWGNQIWLTTGRQDGSELFAICVDLESGNIIHDIKVFDVANPQKAYGGLNTHATPTPVVEDGRIYVHFGTYGTACRTEYEWAKDAMKDYTGGVMDTSTKYSVAHMYSSRRPMEWEKRMAGEGWLKDYKAWLNLRNDDIFMHRFGSPDYVREFIKNMPHEHIRGFYMGSDGYFWGREFISKEPELAGRLEIDKHWYNFRMFGEMAFNNELDDNYWKAVLKHRFGLSSDANVDLLFNAWETVSEVVPQLNRSVWAATDGDFAPEMCQGHSFLSMDNYYFDRQPMKMRNPPPAGEEHCISATKWAEDIVAGKNADPDDKLTPLEVADKLDGYAQTALDALPTLEAQIGNNVELKEVLLDIKSMAYLGQYYADKQRCAAKLMVYRLGGRRDNRWHEQAVSHIEDSRDHWKQYADVLDSHYKTSLHAKTGWFRWYDTLKQVEDEVERVKGEGALPVIEFVDLADGDKFDTGENLEVKVNVTAASGLDKVKLYLNGLVMVIPRK